MKKFFTVDAHEDIAFHLTFFERDFVNPDKPCMITLPWLEEAGVRLVFNTVFIHPKFKPVHSVENAMLQLDTYDQLFENYPDKLIPVKSSTDLDHLENTDKIGFITLMEGADPIRDPKDLYEYHDRGVRIIGPAWNNRNIYASGHETGRGLSDMGKDLIKTMNELSITLDLSHLNIKSFWDCIELTELIPIASHSNARNLTDHPRNLSDGQLKAISKSNGVIGIVFYNEFIKRNKIQTSIEDIYAHIDYIVDLCGEDHVGIGSDLDGARITDFPEEMRQISKLPAVANYLMNKGYSEKVVSKIMGGNFLRVLKSNLG